MERSKALILTSMLLLIAVAYSSTILMSDYAAISMLSAELEQTKRGMWLQTVLVVEHVDGQGNVVQRVVKKNDLPTKNFIAFLGLMLSWRESASTMTNLTILKDTTGAVRNWTTSGDDFSFGLDYVRIGWGSGTVAPTIDDFELNTLGGKDTVDQVTYYMNSTHMWVKIVMTHEFTDAYTINEIGLYVRAWTVGASDITGSSYRLTGDPTSSATYDTTLTASGYDPSSGTSITFYCGHSLGEYLLFRDVLSSSVDIPANEAVTITYYIYVQYA